MVDKAGFNKIPVKYWTWGMVLLVVLFIGAIRWRLLEMPLERDEGEYAYTGQLMLQGIAPYKIAYFMKLPGAHAAYAVIMAVFGQTPAGIHFGLLLVNTATIILVFLLGKRLADTTAGVIACACYGLMSVSPYVLGLQAHATHFVVLPALMGILLLCRATESSRIFTYFLSGLFLGIGFLMKQPGVFFMIFGALLVFWFELQARPFNCVRFLKRGIVFSLGAILPYIVACLILWRAGVFQRFWFWTVTCVRSYGSILTISEGWDQLFHYFTLQCGPNQFLWLLGGLGFFFLLFDRKAGRGKLIVLGLLFFSVLATSQGLYFRHHYFILILPVLALVMGAGLGSAQRFLLTHKLLSNWALMPVTLFLLTFGYVVWAQNYFFFFTTPNEACQIIYQTNPFIESSEIARYIKEHTAVGDRIAVLGSEPQLYFYSGRHSATGYIYVYDLMEPSPLGKKMQRDMIQEVEAARPEMMVMVNVVYSWNKLSETESLIFDWAAKYLHDHYEMVGVIEHSPTEPAVFHWGDEAVAYSSLETENITVWKKKTSTATAKIGQ